ncbi:Flagellar motor switch protein FliM [Pseudooceanicola batsensis HTCC2597]|uniref:Flagellar motor switch protein FliM n=1 Tax=Pseudooceanicola batsensis (strain ATCC BAA-863 / DSM 15984 / KCTC 12145 / HTCC2597) TaxID=252305 RepID=A3U1I7_PSEBH|nr:FliM/FliN family flagellar motor switch protein [Pseudooceanicola batsensis]EAQ02170.1 Flagellar motor switch protein FliM [Pseudooceanicola batsensis HTCC2597]
MSASTAKADPKLPAGTPVEEEIIQKAKRSYERLPILEVILERFSLAVGPAIKHYVGAICESSIDAIDYLPTGDALESMPSPALISVIESPDWDGPFALVIDPSFLISTLEITFGGRMAGRSEWVPRSFTAIEKKIGTEVTQLMLNELSETFGQLAQIEFTISHIETNAQAMVLAPPNTGCVRLRMHVTMDDRDGYFYIVMPFNALSNIRNMLVQPFHGGSLGGDKSWRKNMTEVISDTDVLVTARLFDTKVPLQEVLEWKRGQVLDLGIEVDQPVSLICSGHEMYMAQTGKRKNGRMALKITEQLKDEEEMTDVLPD